MSNIEYELIDYLEDLDNIDINSNVVLCQGDISQDPLVTPQMLQKFRQGLVEEGIFRVKKRHLYSV